MYISDYAYAASPDYWGKYTYEYGTNAAAANRLYLDNIAQWLISHASSDNYDVFDIASDGSINGDNNATAYHYVRLTFYLVSDIQYTGKSGTLSDPYRVN